MYYTHLQKIYNYQKSMNEIVEQQNRPSTFGGALEYDWYKHHQPGTGYFEAQEGGPEIDPSLFYKFGSPDVAYTESTVTSPEEYGRLKALRELQGVETPLGFDLEERKGPISYSENIGGEEMDQEKLLSELGGTEEAIKDRMIKKFWDDYFTNVQGGNVGGTGFIPPIGISGIPT